LVEEFTWIASNNTCEATNTNDSCDNQSIIKLSKNQGFHHKTKHNIDIWHHFMKENVVNGELQINHISILKQLIDMAFRSWFIWCLKNIVLHNFWGSFWYKIPPKAMLNVW
jgi:hypothetical protein